MAITEISVQELKRRLDAGEHLQIVDVREPWEYALAHLPGTVHIPLAQVPQRSSELDPGGELIVMCKSGGRSRRAAEFLQASGFQRVINLTGGIDAWAREIDPSVPTY
ncbi:MAG TPA: rhodanese-like domain-containing protein [Steroidobacteraceae bacterium]|jgi:adenylyltransferase/sulfurtransferase|nr:rhodanese-like domain-containing protein [Steroidobacteraceae bacterium]